jgi:antitoxin component of MazEF toxin-antitoxin module
MRKLTHLGKHGNSTAVCVPREFLYALNWICGQNVMLELLEDKSGVVVRLPRVEDFGAVLPPRLITQQLLNR